VLDVEHQSGPIARAIWLKNVTKTYVVAGPIPTLNNVFNFLADVAILPLSISQLIRWRLGESH
jgi:hypothetical protein